MLHRILLVLDNNSKGKIFAVVANLVDWNNAFPRQCPMLGIESFIKNGVRPSLIPVLINYFQDRNMSVKWHGCYYVPKSIKGGGLQGATLGLLESQVWLDKIDEWTKNKKNDDNWKEDQNNDFQLHMQTILNSLPG